MTIMTTLHHYPHTFQIVLCDYFSLALSSNFPRKFLIKLLHIQGNNSWETVLSGSLSAWKDTNSMVQGFCYCSGFSFMTMLELQLCVYI